MINGEYLSFLQQQSSIYRRMESEGESSHEAKRDAAIGTSVILVAAVPSLSIQKSVAEAAEAHAGTASIIKYGPGSAHVTLLDLGVHSGRMDMSSTENAILLDQLSAGVQSAQRNGGGVIIFDRFITASAVTIAPGVPDATFYSLRANIVDACAHVAGARPGWGSHITVARSTGRGDWAKPNPAAIPLGMVVPRAIVVASLYVGETEIEFSVHHEFLL